MGEWIIEVMETVSCYWCIHLSLVQRNQDFVSILKKRRWKKKTIIYFRLWRIVLSVTHSAFRLHLLFVTKDYIYIYIYVNLEYAKRTMIWATQPIDIEVYIIIVRKKGKNRRSKDMNNCTKIINRRGYTRKLSLSKATQASKQH